MTPTPPPYDGPPVADQDPPLPPTPPGPRKRVERTVKMQVLALLASIPVAAGALDQAGVDVDPAVMAIAVGVPTAAGVLVAAVWNLVDAWKGNG